MVVVPIVGRSSSIEFHITALQSTMYGLLRNGDEVIFHPRAYQLEMLEESLNDHQMDTGSGKTNMHVLQGFWGCPGLATNSIKEPFYGLGPDSSVSRQKRCLFPNVLEWLLRVSAILSGFSARPWHSPNNSTRFFPFSFRHFKAGCFLVMMGSIGGASKAYGTTR